MKDPLAGLREAINRGADVITWPDEHGCPVKKGEEFKLRSCRVVIASTDRALIKGKWLHRARLLRYLPDVARIPASQHGLAHPPQYVSGSHGAVDGIGEEVPPDYQRRLAEEGRVKTAMQGAEQRRQGKVLRQEQRLAEGLKARTNKAVVRHIRSATSFSDRPACIPFAQSSPDPRLRGD